MIVIHNPSIIFLPQIVKKQEIQVNHLHIYTFYDEHIHTFSSPCPQ